MRLEGVPEGYEVVRWGPPNEGDEFVSLEGDVTTASYKYDDPRLIVRKVEPIATWKHGVFADCWIAQDQSGEVYAWERCPQLQDDEWMDGKMIVRLDVVFRRVLSGVFRFRDDLPWTERCVQVGPSVENA